MGTISKFLRTSGARAFINLEKWKSLSNIPSDLLTMVEEQARELINTPQHLEQISKQDFLYLQFNCKSFPQDIYHLIASFLPICFISLEVFGKAQDEWKIVGYWYDSYIRSLLEAYSCMVIENNDGEFKYNTYYVHDPSQSQLMIQSDTPLMKELKNIPLTPNFVIDLRHTVTIFNLNQDENPKKRKFQEKQLPRIEFQYEEHCLFYLEFQRFGLGINVGYIDYFHNMMRSDWRPILWDINELQFSDEGDYDDYQEFEEIDQIMAEIPMSLLSSSIVTNMFCKS